MKSAVAGTFNVLHDGHKALISEAFHIADYVYVAITSDGMAATGRTDFVPLYIRLGALKKYLDTFKKPYETVVIDDMYGPREKIDEADVLVVSEETYENGLKLVEDRKVRSGKKLELSVVPLLKAFDGSKISSSAIMRGAYGKNGDEEVPDIVVGSLNHVKVEAVRTVMERIYGYVRITAADVPSEVPPQPFEEQTRQGAVNRARNALGNHDLSVGIEAGVFEMKDGLYDFQYCAVLDKNGKLTVGTGMGFMYPEKIAEEVRSGATVGDAVHTIYGNTDIGKKQGAVGLLSKGLIDRKTLTEQSVTAAMIPRIWDE